MKDKSKKHDHKGTKILKLSIFASVMLAPLFAIGFKCAYATFNKNAYQSYSYINDITYTNANTKTAINGQEYQIRYNPNGTNTGYQYFYVYDGQTNINDLYLSSPYKEKTISRVTIETSGQNIYCYFTDNTYTNVYRWYEISYNFNLIYNAQNPINIDTTNKYYEVWAVNYYYGKLDNAFYYAVNQMKDNELFAWTKNTALYTPINAMTNGLGITTDAIAVLLAYWLYITLIYVVFDIVIELFTYLSHLIMGNPIG